MTKAGSKVDHEMNSNPMIKDTKSTTPLRGPNSQQPEKAKHQSDTRCNCCDWQEWNLQLLAIISIFFIARTLAR